MNMNYSPVLRKTYNTPMWKAIEWRIYAVTLSLILTNIILLFSDIGVIATAFLIVSLTEGIKTVAYYYWAKHRY